MKKTRIFWVLGTVFSTSVATYACGGSDDSGGNDGDGGESATGGTGDDGSVGGTSSGGTSSSGGAGGTAPSCDTSSCEGVTVLDLIPLQTCCLSESQCGVDFGGECTDVDTVRDQLEAGIPMAEPEPIYTDPACGGFPITFGSLMVTLEGCCDQTGVCGVNIGTIPGNLFAAACVTGDELMFPLPPDAGPPPNCDYPGDGGTPPGSEPQPDAATNPPEDASATD